MLNLRIVRGPLADAEEATILQEFNRLTHSAIGRTDFRRWIRDAPDGPAWHAILKTDDSRVVGHFCLIPLRFRHQGKTECAARTEYFFVHEDFRREKVRGFESSFMPGGLLLLDRLYRHCRNEGWQPLIVSASEEIQRLHQAVGCRAAHFALTECLFILRPFDAAHRTPNLTVKQRLAVFLAGAAQRGRWWVRFLFASSPDGLRFTTVDSICVHPFVTTPATMGTTCWAGRVDAQPKSANRHSSLFIGGSPIFDDLVVDVRRSSRAVRRRDRRIRSFTASLWTAR
jgi:hypothetical protein